VLDLLAPAANGFAAEPSDNRQRENGARPPLYRQQADKPTAIALIKASHHAVNRPMLLGALAIRMTATLMAATNMHRLDCFRRHLGFLILGTAMISPYFQQTVIFFKSGYLIS
jgi:hypothetical protein